MVRAVIFDLDDTLISERQYIESGYHYIARLLGNRLKMNDKELFDSLISLFEQSTVHVFNRLLDELRIPYSIDTIVELVQEYREHFPNIYFYSDVIPTLSILKNMGLKLGVITDGYANSQRQKIKAISARDYFNEIIITDEIGREYWKPHPRSFELMSEKLNVKIDELMYVGDNPQKDFLISQIYPIRTVRINRSGIYKNSNYLNDVRETYSITCLGELVTLIR